MEQWEREFHVARIVLGRTKVTVDNTVVYIVTPTKEQRYDAAEVYRNARRDAQLDGALTDEELLALLVSQYIWDSKQKKDLKELVKALEDLKVGLYENRFKSNAKTTIRTAIKKTRNEIARLELLRHGLDYVTVEGLAISAKYRYLTGVTIRYEDGTPYVWDKEDSLVDKVMESLTSERLVEADYREIARTEPWRSIWSSKGQAGRGLFDCAAVDISDEQRNLMIWSSVYDNIREYPDCPPDNVICDDDMLDGWMIIQRRKREGQATAQEGERIGNERIRNADEQFIFVDTVKDAKKIDKMNSPMAATTKAQRLSYLKSKGEVNEVDMPDTAQRIQMEFNKLEQMKRRQGK